MERVWADLYPAVSSIVIRLNYYQIIIFISFLYLIICFGKEFPKIKSTNEGGFKVTLWKEKYETCGIQHSLDNIKCKNFSFLVTLYKDLES